MKQPLTLRYTRVLSPDQIANKITRPIDSTYHAPVEVCAVRVLESAEPGVEGAVAAAVGARLEVDVVEGDVAAISPRLVRLVLGNRLENHLRNGEVHLLPN